MKIEDIGEVIAVRVLKMSINGGEPQDLIVRLGKPRQFGEDGDCICPFDIDTGGVNGLQIRCAYGVDAFDCLRLVLPMISSSVLGFKYQGSSGKVRSVEIWWHEKGDNAGFPPSDERGGDEGDAPFPRQPA